MTIGELYGPAMQVSNQAEADRYLDFLISRCQKESGKTRIECAEIQKQNLGYYAGYYDNETRRRVERLFRCVHPIFGAIETEGVPSAEKALAAGIAAGKTGKVQKFKQPSSEQPKRKSRVFDLS